MEAVVIADSADRAIDQLDDAVEKTILLPYLRTLGVVSIVKSTANRDGGRCCSSTSVFLSSIINNPCAHTHVLKL